MKTQKTKFILFVLLLTFALMMTACQTAQDTPEPASGEEPMATPVADTNVDEEPAEAPSNMVVDTGVDPANEALGDAASHFSTLTDASGAPLLAANAEISDDELDYILDLNTGILFEDGTPMNADAVIANFNRWFDPENETRGDGEYAAWAALFGGFKCELDETEKPLSTFDGIEKVNDFTVLIHLNTPVPNMLIGLSDPAFSILSPTALAQGEFVGTGQ